MFCNENYWSNEMKKLGFLIAILIVVAGAAMDTSAQNTVKGSEVYDAEAAKRTGADDYGMHGYIFAILREGKVKRPEAKELEKLQTGHLKNIMRLGDEGKLVLAGPFMDEGDMRGIFIFNVKTVEEAKKLVETDPLVAGGFLELEFRPWYGSAALVDVVTQHKKLQKKKMVE
jgi:uncharacterized protein